MLPLIWTVGGILLVLAEFLVPGLIIIFFGTAALITGLAIYAGLPTDYGLPFLLFATLSILQLVIVRRHFKKWFTGGNAVNQQSLEEFIGHEAIVISGFAEGDTHGKVEFKGASWSALCDEPLQPGERVRISSREGITLTVNRPSQS